MATDAMVTGRMSPEKKEEGNRILASLGSNPSQAINQLYDFVIAKRALPFADKPAGTAELTLFLLAIVRLMNPKVLLPATTALGTIEGDGRERGILAGCNVVMPNLSPQSVRKKYMLYDNKLSSGEEAAEARAALERRVEAIGYRVVTDRGDYKG